MSTPTDNEPHHALRDRLETLLADEGLPGVTISQGRHGGDLTLSVPDFQLPDLDAVEQELNLRGWRCFREEGALTMTTRPEDGAPLAARAGLVLRPQDVALWNEYGRVRRAGMHVQVVADNRVNLQWYPTNDATMVGNPGRLTHEELDAVRWYATGRAEARLEHAGWTVQQRRAFGSVFLLATAPEGAS